MKRRLIIESDLIDKINNLLKEHDGTSKCRVTRVYRLKEPDANGCNWSIDYVRTGGRSSEIMPIVNKIISDFQLAYNIKDQDKALQITSYIK